MQSLVQLYMLLAIFCLLLFKSFREILVNYYLKTLLLLLLVITALKVLTQSGTIASTVWVYIIGNTALFLFMPGVYLYLKNQLHHQRTNKRDLAHLIPATAYCLSCLIIYLFDSKFDLPQVDIFNEASGSQGLPFVYFLVFGYGVTGWYLILVLKILKDRYSFPKKEMIATATVYAAKEQAESVKPIELHAGSMFLSDERILKMDVMIKVYLEEQQPFLKHGYSLRQLAEDTHLAVHLLSAFINKHYKVNFNDFINEYRVNYCKVKILNDEWKYKKLEAIADESGFSNRNTFTVAFKRVTGLNPSEFLKAIKEQQAA